MKKLNYKKIILSMLLIPMLSQASLTVLDSDIVINETIPKSSHIQIFIDADNNPTTGYSRPSNKDMKGAEYLIEDKTLFKRKKGVKGWSAGWAKIGGVKIKRANDKTVITFSKSIMDLKDGASFQAFSLNSKWEKKSLKKLGNSKLSSMAQTEPKPKPATNTDAVVAGALSIKLLKNSNGGVNIDSIKSNSTEMLLPRSELFHLKIRIKCMCQFNF